MSGGFWGGEEELIEKDSSSKVTFIHPGGRMEQEVGRVLVRTWRPAGRTLAQDLSAMALEDLLPHLRQPLISPGLCARAANNQLKLADFSTFVREPAALARLSICRKGSREPEAGGKKAFKSLFLFIFLFSAPPPCSLHCHASFFFFFF